EIDAVSRPRLGGGGPPAEWTGESGGDRTAGGALAVGFESVDRFAAAAGPERAARRGAAAVRASHARASRGIVQGAQRLGSLKRRPRLYRGEGRQQDQPHVL